MTKRGKAQILEDEEIDRRHDAGMEVLHEVYYNLGYRYCPYCGRYLITSDEEENAKTS